VPEGDRTKATMSLLERSELASLQPLKFILNWGRRYSLWLLNFGVGLLRDRADAASMSKHDFIRFGVIPVAHGPRQADLLIVTDTVTDKDAAAPEARLRATA
jgi:NADH:ubiquinone oxidoreductase subunit B-like Fe-S oxidoreductase